MFNSMSIFSPSPRALPVSDFELCARRVQAVRLPTCGGFLPFTKRPWAAKRLPLHTLFSLRTLGSRFLRQDCVPKIEDFMSDPRCGRWQRAMWSQKQTCEWTSSKPLRLVHLDGQDHSSQMMAIYPVQIYLYGNHEFGKASQPADVLVVFRNCSTVVTTTDLQRPTDHSRVSLGLVFAYLVNFVS